MPPHMGDPAPVGDAERLRRLQLLTDAALASLELDELLAVLLERVREVLDVEMCAVLMLDEATGELVARAAVGIEDEVEQGLRVPVGRGFAGRVAAERRPIVVEDVDEAEVLSPLLRRRGIRSLLGVPLLARGEAIGVLQAGSLTPRRFTSQETELLTLVAERAAVGIEHARLFEAERAARTRIEHLQAVTDTALGHLEVNELLAELLPRIREILAADTCAVLLLDPERDELVARAAVGIEEEVEQGVRVPIGRGFAGRVAAERHPVALETVDEAHVVNPLLWQKGIKSLLGVPLLARGDVIGVLHVGTLAQRTFRSDEIELLGLVAERVALAVERSRLHEQTVELEELKSAFVAIASHELRTPASSVYGVLATLVGREGLDEETREDLLHVGYQQAERLRRLIEQLLDLSQLDARHVPVEPRPVVVRSSLEEIVAAAGPEARNVRIDAPPDLAAVLDPLVLDRVVSNLLANAMRHGMPPIVVAAARTDSHLRIVVEDAGSGVPEELRERLFERFVRGDDARGSGLGLTIARAYARAHGGELVFAPSRRGARFELVVPQG
jgi:signal transduction histidine kinase